MKMKRLLSLVLSLVMVLALLVPTYAEDNITVTATSDKSTVQKGDTFTITVKVGAATNKIAAIQVQLEYDNTKLKVASIQNGALANKFNGEVTDEETYIDAGLYVNGNAVENSAESTLFTVSFEVLTDKGGSVAPKLVVKKVNDASIPAKQYDVSATQPTVSVPYAVTGVSVTAAGDKTALKYNESVQLTAAITPPEATTTITWKSSNTSVATVNASGLVTAKSKTGTAVITATAANGVSGTITITVTNCLHSNVTQHDAEAATCTAAGNIAYWECGECHTKWSDAAKTTIVTDVTIAKIPHTKTDVVSAVAPDCVTDGTKGYYLCSGCGFYYLTDGDVKMSATTAEAAAAEAKIDKLGHTYKNIAAVAKTCTKAGNKEYLKCSRCSKLFDKDTKAEITADSVIIPASHELKDVAAKESTCVVAGWDAYKKCEKCGKLFKMDGTTELSAVPMRALKAHTYDNVWHSNKDGHYHECTFCHQAGTVEKHVAGAAATETAPQRCTECNYIMTPATGHKDHVKDPQADWVSDQNTHWHACTGCSTHLDEAGHTVSSWTVDKAATTTETGVKHGTCSVCKREVYQTIAKITTGGTTGGNNVGPAKNPYEKNDTTKKDNGKTVESGRTFDAGIALYVGLSLLSVTGGALVIGKKKEF